jgi:hypothetical protein
MREPLESDVLDRPDVDPLIWLHAQDKELHDKYPNWDDYIAYVNQCGKEFEEWKQSSNSKNKM